MMLKHRKEPWFQVSWATLHLTAAVMHMGSFLYHLRRVNEEDGPKAAP